MAFEDEPTLVDYKLGIIILGDGSGKSFVRSYHFGRHEVECGGLVGKRMIL